MKLPFIDLHIHIDGSMPLATAAKLREHLGLPPLSLPVLKEQLMLSGQCGDLNAYLDRFSVPLSLLQEPYALTLLTYSVLCRQKEQGVVYTELRFSPQSHTRNGLTQRQAVLAVLEGLEQFEKEQARSSEASPALHAGVLLCCMRFPDNERENRETIALAAEYRHRGIVGVDLAGAEALFPTRSYRPVFREAKDCGLSVTIHAGEAAGPDSIREALELGADRIGHGIRCLSDPSLVERLIREQIPLECCPTSNLHTMVFSSLSDYPIRKMLKLGLRATVNTDNMTVSDTSLPEEFARLEAALSLTEEEKKQLLLNSAASIFGTSEEQLRIRKLLEQA